jgi:hypothetical protein
VTERYRATLHDRIYHCDFLLGRGLVGDADDDDERTAAIAFITELRSEYRHALSELSLRRGN